MREAATQAMSAAERQAYEEKKLKLRRAMADGTLNPEQPQDSGKEERHQNLAAAMKDDNWSALIQEQTRETQA